ncbi:dNTP triphosphohydrolase [Sinorhizobium meliloti]|uniref:deoxyguanosinetriphosphate triphosphohydrolase family protein n=1 Tax=Rhizobium meliloti TaxID=382 RepID=UPI0020735FB9|nr:dNTP triphosphohydrolase [Sinorhizobium meliloti]MCM5691426.1 dNTP triphosphohydrolase [Sinorhizobium meliloti]
MLPPKWSSDDRAERYHDINKEDQRSPFGIDRDRVQYSSAFHRLAGVTQIVRAGESDVFHTRQQHTYKVAQIGRRLAQLCEQKFESETAVLGVDVEAVEAACLAHDLGHPPFGHAGESALNSLVEQHGDPDGFEGNAQTFRIITKLSVRFTEIGGLNLTRATLAGCLKYPWYRDPTHPNKTKKWSSYKVDADAFEFARKYHSDDEQTPEAALMDWADDIAYSVHDLEDFHRCNAIPWRIILEEDGKEVKAAAKERWHNSPHDVETLLDAAYGRIVDLIKLFPPDLLAPYDGSRPQRVSLRTFTSELIGRFIKATTLVSGGSGVRVPKEIQAEVRLLKEITKHYIISNPSLLAQQRGQQKIISDIFTALVEESKKSPAGYLPARLRYIWDYNQGSSPRFAADCISSLTEREVISLHDRMFGTNAGSVLDPIVR